MKWSWPKWIGLVQIVITYQNESRFGPDQFILVVTKSLWSSPNQFGQTKTFLNQPKLFWSHRRTKHKCLEAKPENLFHQTTSDDVFITGCPPKFSELPTSELAGTTLLSSTDFSSSKNFSSIFTGLPKQSIVVCILIELDEWILNWPAFIEQFF